MSWCSYDDGDAPKFCEVREIKKARKEHTCCECRDAILPGSPYVYITGLWDGDFCTFHQHQECAEACRAVRDGEGDGCIPFGYYTEWLGESWGYREKWTKRMRTSAAAMILKHKSIKDAAKIFISYERRMNERKTA